MERTTRGCPYCYPQNSGLNPSSGICSGCLNQGEGHKMVERDGELVHLTDERGDWIPCVCSSYTEGNCIHCEGSGLLYDKEEWEHYRDIVKEEQENNINR